MTQAEPGVQGPLRVAELAGAFDQALAVDAGAGAAAGRATFRTRFAALEGVDPGGLEVEGQLTPGLLLETVVETDVDAVGLLPADVG